MFLEILEFNKNYEIVKNQFLYNNNFKMKS